MYSTLIRSTLSYHNVTKYSTRNRYAGDEKNVNIRKNDIVVGVKDVKDLTLDNLKKVKKRCTISFLKRPYGRPNLTPADERGWLYAERITVAIRMAAAKEEMFDDVVMSNDIELFVKIQTWSEALRRSAKFPREHRDMAIRVRLDAFKAVLRTMKFTFPDNDKLVSAIMEDVVSKLKTNWKEETKRQNAQKRRF